MAGNSCALIIDDEPAIRKLLRASMPEGLSVVEAASGAEGLRHAATYNPAIILLDLGLPDVDGLTVIGRLREFCRAPIIILSAREQEGDKVAALDGGASDYVTKPFSVAELQARMRVALREKTSVEEACPSYAFGSVHIDCRTRIVTKDGEDVHLTPIEYQLLLYLLRYEGRVLTHRQILTEVWGKAYEGQIQYLRVFMRNLRHKLETDPAQPRHLLTETGIGYRLRAE